MAAEESLGNVKPIAVQVETCRRNCSQPKCIWGVDYVRADRIHTFVTTA